MPSSSGSRSKVHGHGERAPLIPREIVVPAGGVRHTHSPGDFGIFVPGYVGAVGAVGARAVVKEIPPPPPYGTTHRHR